MDSPYILVLFSSNTGSTHKLARSIARGVNACRGIEARLRTVPDLEGENPESAVAYATVADLAGASGLALGSPTHFGNMGSSLQAFLEKTTGLWFKGGLVNKPLAVFTSSSSMHGGQETTLINMMTPFLHHGMVVVGLPYTLDGLSHTKGGGTPYGASHVSRSDLDAAGEEQEHRFAMAQGKRLAQVALLLSQYQED